MDGVEENMKIMVFDVPAESGGALTILKQYYEKAVKDTLNKWIFVISTPNFIDTANVKILRYPWVKKSWLHRLYFDKFVAHKIVKKYEVDKVISLQNVIINNINVSQTLYLHQSLPFVEKRYRITENFKFWIYQNIISKMIFSSIKKADEVIVQTNWMREACLKKVDTDPDKVIVEQPKISIKVNKKYEKDKSGNILFFYPASGMIYKNHGIIVEAAKKLKEQGIVNYRIIFTLSGNENDYVKKLFKNVKKHNLPIDFIGQISVEEVYEYYCKSVLVFPSYIETFGLPLFEAKMHGSPILASDCKFSHEILDDYDKVTFFDPFNKYSLYEKLVLYCKM